MRLLEYSRLTRQKKFNKSFMMNTCYWFSKIMLKMNKMASKAIITGVIINATAFVGGSYLAKYLSGDQNRVEEKKRQDLAVENYQAAYEKHQEIEQNSLIGLQLMTESRSRWNRICWTQIMLWSCTTRCIIKSLIWGNHNFPTSTSWVVGKSKMKWSTLLLVPRLKD